MYIRLSGADEDTGVSKKESDSVVNQRAYITSFLNGHGTLSNVPRKEFVDDGYSGTRADRPMLNEMLRQARGGEIDTICVKDFSRFFRDYIEIGNYLECVFPFLGVRFISVNDNYDSDNYKGTTGGLEMVARNIVYASYSKDLSVKTTAAKELMMKQGKFVGSHAPFGYIMHPSIKNKLAIDADSAQTVRAIFEDAMEGKTTREIAKRLNEENVLTPAQYFKSKNPDSKKFNFTSKNISWTAAMVYLIITNERYTGALVSGRRKKVSLAAKKCVKKDAIVVPNTHDAIVSRREFEAANRVIGKTGCTQPRMAKEHALKSLVRCKHCGRLMRRKMGAKGKYFFACLYSSSANSTECPRGVRFYQEELETLVLHSIQNFLVVAQQQAAKEAALGGARQKARLAKIETVKKRVRQTTEEKAELYERYASGVVSKKRYKDAKEEIEERYVKVLQTLEVLEQEQLREEEDTTADEMLSLCKLYPKAEQLTNDMAKAFVEAVFVSKYDAIEIKMKFQDVF